MTRQRRRCFSRKIKGLSAPWGGRKKEQTENGAKVRCTHKGHVRDEPFPFPLVLCAVQETLPLTPPFVYEKAIMRRHCHRHVEQRIRARLSGFSATVLPPPPERRTISTSSMAFAECSEGALHGALTSSDVAEAASTCALSTAHTVDGKLAHIVVTAIYRVQGSGGGKALSKTANIERHCDGAHPYAYSPVPSHALGLYSRSAPPYEHAQRDSLYHKSARVLEAQCVNQAYRPHAAGTPRVSLARAVAGGDKGRDGERAQDGGPFGDGSEPAMMRHRWWPLNTAANAMAGVACRNVGERAIAEMHSDWLASPEHATAVSNHVHNRALDVMPPVGVLPLAIMARAWIGNGANVQEAMVQPPTLSYRGLPGRVEGLFDQDNGQARTHFEGMLGLRCSVLAPAMIDGFRPYDRAAIAHMVAMLKRWERPMPALPKDDWLSPKEERAYAQRAHDIVRVNWYASTLCRRLLEQHCCEGDSPNDVPAYCP